MKTYLVTGGVGFLGSHLCKLLLADGHKVIAVDNLSSSSGKNIDPLMGKYFNFSFIYHDITKPIEKDLGKLDGIFNLACPASPPFYQKIPVETTLASVLGGYNMLEMARRHNCRILQTSTSEVYGDPEVSPQKESYNGSVNPFGCRSAYDEGKRCAESLFYDYNKQHGVDIRIVRLFNTYGPNMLHNDGRVVSNFINQAISGKEITIYGGNQTRSFCYVSDTIEGIMSIWNQTVYGGPVNIGNPHEIDINELAIRIIDITNSGSKIVYSPIPVDDPLQRKPDISLALALGWCGPKKHLMDGLQETVDYFREEQKRKIL